MLPDFACELGEGYGCWVGVDVEGVGAGFLSVPVILEGGGVGRAVQGDGGLGCALTAGFSEGPLDLEVGLFRVVLGAHVLAIPS